MGEPALEAVRVLRRELAATAGRHPDHQRHRELAARHVRQRRRAVDDLVQREQAEVAGHDLDDRAQARDRGADTGADEAVLGQRRVDDALRPELLEQALADRVAAAVAAHVLAEQQDARIGVQRITDRLPAGLAVADLLASRQCGWSGRRQSPTGSRDWW